MERLVGFRSACTKASGVTEGACEADPHAGVGRSFLMVTESFVEHAAIGVTSVTFATPKGGAEGANAAKATLSMRAVLCSLHSERREAPPRSLSRKAMNNVRFPARNVSTSGVERKHDLESIPAKLIHSYPKATQPNSSFKGAVFLGCQLRGSHIPSAV